jgi:putative hydrolase of the HAD superfamily
MSKIKAVIWDLAGVVLHPVRGSFNSLLAERLGAPLAEVEKVMDGEQNRLWDIDEIDDIAFFTYLLNALELPLEKMPIIQEFVWKDFRIDREMIAFVREVKETRTTALLTNFPAHVHDFLEKYWHTDGVFKHIIASCDVKLVKPDEAIYRLALERVGCEAEESIFIDDRQVNVDAAKKLGMNAILYQDHESTISAVRRLLNL